MLCRMTLVLVVGAQAVPGEVVVPIAAAHGVYVERLMGISRGVRCEVADEQKVSDCGEEDATLARPGLCSVAL